MESKKQNILKNNIIDWNNRFPFDRFFRQKYNIPFGSEDHRNMCQIDIYLDIYEDKLINKYRERNELYEQYQKEMKTDGRITILKEDTMSEKDLNDMFDNIQLG